MDKIRFSLKYLLLIFILGIVAFYFFKVETVPYVRTDTGWFTQGAYTLAHEGHYGSQMFKGHYGAENTFHSHPPLHYVLVAALYKIPGVGLLQGRYLSLLFSLLSLFVFYQIMKLLLPDKDNIYFLIGLCLLLSTPLFFVASRGIRPEISILFYSLSAYYLLLKYHLAEAKKLYIFLAGIFCACALVSHVPGFFIFLYAFIFICKIDRKSILPLLFGFAIPSLIYLAWILAHWSDFYGQVFLFWKAHSPGGTQLGNIILKVSGFLMMKAKVTIYLLFFSIIFIYTVFRQKSIINKQYFWLLLLPLLCYFFQLLLLPHPNGLYFSILLPFIYINTVYIYSMSTHKKLLSVMLAMFFVINCYGGIKYFNKYKDYNYSNYINRLLVNIPKNSTIVGNVSLYPGIQINQSYTLYPYDNPQIGGVLNYEELRNKLYYVYNVQYIVVDQWTSEHMISGLAEFIEKDTVEFDHFISPDYGSEGNSGNNLIRVFKVNSAPSAP